MATNIFEYFGNVMCMDLLDFSIGARLGGGAGREVFVCATNTDFVIKFETTKNSFQNILEWELYNDAIGSTAEKWLAPCERISENGKVLMQRRTQPLGWEQRPKMMPRFFSDFKINNFGTINGHVVAHDYGMHMVSKFGLSCRMHKANWWQENCGESDK